MAYYVGFYSGQETPKVNYKFTHLSTLPISLTLTRSGTSATYFDSNGVLQPTTANQPRFDHDLSGNPQGLLYEDTKINYCLHNRDLTNAVWVKLNATASKEQTGLDNGANEASSITATANNGTCLQAITLASGNRKAFFYVGRLSGTGTIEVTLNGGSTWLDVTSDVDAASGDWVRVETGRATLSNPSVGFRLGTSGDSIKVDCCQLETTFVTSPIITTSSAVTRQADTLLLDDIDWFNATEGTFLMETKFADDAFGGTKVLFNMSDNSYNERYIFLLQGGTTPRGQAVDGGSSVFLPSTTATISDGLVLRQIMGYELNNAIYRDNNENTTFTDTSGVTLPTVTQARFGSDHTGGGRASMWIRSFQYYNKRFTDAQTVGLL